MEKLRDETLDEILKKEEAYPHELRLLIPELQLLRDIYNGKKPPEAYGKDAVTIHFPNSKIMDDDYSAIGDAIYMNVGTTRLVRWSSMPNNRYLIHRIK